MVCNHNDFNRAFFLNCVEKTKSFWWDMCLLLGLERACFTIATAWASLPCEKIGEHHCLGRPERQPSLSSLHVPEEPPSALKPQRIVYWTYLADEVLFSPLIASDLPEPPLLMAHCVRITPPNLPCVYEATCTRCKQATLRFFLMRVDSVYFFSGPLMLLSDSVACYFDYAWFEAMAPYCICSLHFHMVKATHQQHAAPRFAHFCTI